MLLSLEATGCSSRNFRTQVECQQWLENGHSFPAPVRGSDLDMGSAIERAFALAKSGQYRSVSEVIRHLPVEDRHTVEAHLAQPQARRELILLCSAAWLATQ